MGYRIIRIPYFVQLTSDVVAHYFGMSDVDMQVNFPHGFIVDKGEKLPAEFCSLGIARFINELHELHFLREAIVCSFNLKIEKYGGDKSHVLPIDMTQFNAELDNILQ